MMIWRLNASLQAGSRPSNFVDRRLTVPRKQKDGKVKLKTHKATSKRFKLSGSGLLMRTKGGKSHLRRRTSKRTKALLDEMIVVQGEGYIKHVRRLTPSMKKGE
jgi:large subunit ribosomal protein L35